jgi:pyrroline-5-carboxylate reductase
VLVVGVGNMGEALISGMLDVGLFKKESLFGLDISKERRSYIQEVFGVKVFLDPQLAFREASPTIVLLCVKPQVMEEVLSTIKGLPHKGPFFITIAAGVRTGFIEQALGEKTRVARVMPNTPVIIREGISAISFGRNTTREDEETTKRIFSSLGEVVEVDEDLMDAVTGLSGSGPAYIFEVIDALCEGGVREGLSREVSLKLTIQTAIGAARLIMESGASPIELCKKVASPGGTTIEGLKVLEKRGLRSTLMEAVASATMRSKELSRG